MAPKGVKKAAAAVKATAPAPDEASPQKAKKAAPVDENTTPNRPAAEEPAKRKGGRPKKVVEEAPASPPARGRAGKQGRGRKGKPDSGTLSPMVKNMARKLRQQAQAAEELDVPGSAKKPAAKKENRTQELLGVIRRTIRSIPFKEPCVAGVRLHPAVLTSYDDEGFPSMRTVIPYDMADDLSEVRLRTNMTTRKVQEIQRKSKASLHYQDQRGRGGWVTLKGDAKVILLEGEQVEIALMPERCECVSYIEGPTSADNGEGWKPAVLVRANGGEGWRRAQ